MKNILYGVVRFVLNVVDFVIALSRDGITQNKVSFFMGLLFFGIFAYFLGYRILEIIAGLFSTELANDLKKRHYAPEHDISKLPQNLQELAKKERDEYIEAYKKYQKRPIITDTARAVQEQINPRLPNLNNQGNTENQANIRDNQINNNDQTNQNHGNIQEESQQPQNNNIN